MSSTTGFLRPGLHSVSFGNSENSQFIKMGPRKAGKLERFRTDKNLFKPAGEKESSSLKKVNVDLL